MPRYDIKAALCFLRFAMSYSAVLLPTLHKLLQGLGQLLGCWAYAWWAAGCLLGARGDNDDGDDDDDDDTDDDDETDD